MEIRLYFESLEQSYHFLYPIVYNALREFRLENEIKLVKIRGNCERYSKNIAPIIFWKEPDAMLSIVKDDIEYPLLLIEFSNAVFTEDHELQRFDGLVAAAKNNCFYAKISPSSKPSPSEHGGNIEFDCAIPYSVIQRQYGKTFFHFEWECDEKGVVEVDKNYLSCPKRNNNFEFFVTTILREAITRGITKDWMDSVLRNLEKNSFFSNWTTRLRGIAKVDVTMLNTSRTTWKSKDELLGMGVLELKLNRFGHAMDPERGMLAYYGSIGRTVVSKMMFSETNNAWYKDINQENTIEKYIEEHGLREAYDFLVCFSLGSGLYKNSEFMEIVRKCKRQSLTININLTEFIVSNFFELNKQLRTIFGYSSLFVIEDTYNRRRVIFNWTPYNEPSFFERYQNVGAIYERNILEEDDVTYITVHNILRPNDYEIIAVSYPGAQADRRILIQPGTGRRQPRKYVDVISFLPKKFTNLQENKGLFSSTEVQNDIIEMSKYKRNNDYIKGLIEFKKMFAPESLDTVVKVGVGFWSNGSFSISNVRDLDLNDLDYFIYITEDRKHWQIWRNGPNDMFKIMKGIVDIPKTYDTNESSSSVSPSLESFFR